MDLIASNLLLILCFVVGTGLVITEAFIPGFGIAGISGVVLEIVAIILTGRRFGTVPALIALFGVLLVIGLAVFISYRRRHHPRGAQQPEVRPHSGVLRRQQSLDRPGGHGRNAPASRRLH